MKPITKETRELIVAAKERGEKPKIIAVWFNVALSSVYNILVLYRKTNDVAPKPYLGRPSRLTGSDLEKIRAVIKEKNERVTIMSPMSALNAPQLLRLWGWMA